MSGFTMANSRQPTLRERASMAVYASGGKRLAEHLRGLLRGLHLHVEHLLAAVLRELRRDRGHPMTTATSNSIAAGRGAATTFSNVALGESTTPIALANRPSGAAAWRSRQGPVQSWLGSRRNAPDVVQSSHSTPAFHYAGGERRFLPGAGPDRLTPMRRCLPFVLVVGPGLFRPPGRSGSKSSAPALWAWRGRLWRWPTMPAPSTGTRLEGSRARPVGTTFGWDDLHFGDPKLPPAPERPAVRTC